MLLKQKLYVSLILAIVLPLTISTLLFTTSIRTHTEQKLANVDLPTTLNEVKNGIELALSIFDEQTIIAFQTYFPLKEVIVG